MKVKKILVILGSGKASRLEPISNFVPKMLINIGQKTTLESQLDVYSKFDLDEIFLIVNSVHSSLVKSYLERFDLKVPVHVRTYDIFNGSANAINSIKGEITGHNVIFNWSDVVPVFNTLSFGKNVVYTYGNECRYSYDAKAKNVILKPGGVVGIYQVKEFSELVGEKQTHELDLADCLVGEFVEEPIEVIDMGDFAKLSKIEPVVTRSFNSVTFKGDYVIKSALNERGKDLQELEYDWYKNAGDSHFSEYIPKVTMASDLILERIYGPSLFEYLSSKTSNQAIQILQNLKNIIDVPKINVSHSQKVTDYDIEILKTNTRINDVLDVWSEMCPGTFEEDYKNAKNLINKAYCVLTESLEDIKYQFFHGDLNFSNILVDDGVFKFIDPRGYFGNSKNIGPYEYEEAKILYGLSGYDKFNRDLTWAGMDFNNNKVNVNVEVLPGFKGMYESSPVRVKIWLGLIWMSLSGYFKNNPYKSVAAIYNGIKILESIDELK